MPIPHTVCLQCKQCGWKAVRTESDVIPGDLRLLGECPSCGGKLMQVKPSLFDQVNPLNRWRGLFRF